MEFPDLNITVWVTQNEACRGQPETLPTGPGAGKAPEPWVSWLSWAALPGVDTAGTLIRLEGPKLSHITELPAVLKILTIGSSPSRSVTWSEA